MPGKKKKFIDKKNAVTFHLVHRSQKDPLQADDDASRHVLAAAGGDKSAAARKVQQVKFGVLYDDDYDYLQHLRDADELYDVQPTESSRTGTSLKHAIAKNEPSEKSEPRLQLPSAAFASCTETDVGLLNKAAPRSGPKLDWDPDIVAALDEDFDFEDDENQLEDDFIMKANAEGGDEELEMDDGDLFENEDEAQIFKPVFRRKVEVLDKDAEEGENEDDMSEEDTDSDFGSLDEKSFGDVETKSRFTNYSMTSSVIQRNQGLTLLDDRFEKVFEQYDDEEIGALDQEDIGGHVDSNGILINSLMEEFEKQRKKKTLKDVMETSEGLQQGQEEEESDEEMETVEVMEAPREKWDCESILTTHSTLYNHPTKITEPRKVKPIRLSKREGIPLDVLDNNGAPQQSQTGRERLHQLDPAPTYRAKDETAEERKERKRAVKEERKMRREEKKTNKECFKEEKMRQQKEALNLSKNLRGIKIS